MEDVGLFLRKVREGQKKSLREVALRARSSKFSKQTAHLIEKNKLAVTQHNVDVVSAAYGLKRDERNKLEKLVTERVKIADVKNTLREEAELVYRMLLLSKEARERVVRAVRSYEAANER